MNFQITTRMKTSVVKIRCKNNKKTAEYPIGITLSEIFSEMNLPMPHGAMAAKVNNKVVGLGFQLFRNKDVEFLDITSPSGLRAYTRSLFLVLCKAVKDLFGQAPVRINIPVSNGSYCDLNLGRPVTEDDVTRLRNRIQELIDAALPFTRHECPTDEAIKRFEELGDKQKAKLLRSSQSLYCIYYELDGYIDNFYGTLLTNTSELYLFGLEKYGNGLFLRVPSPENPDELAPMVKQEKMFEIFQEHHRWQDMLGVRTAGDFNEAVREGYAIRLINVSEALQEKKIARFAEQVAERRDIRMVLIAGPSSSGKTTFSKRLSVQLIACGIMPVAISLDDYFVDRDKTPKDEHGELDYESLYALNIDLLNRQLKALFEGKKVQLPRYDFQTGKSIPDGGKLLQLRDNEVLIVEGIHALNPTLTEQIESSKKFSIYASAITTIMLDDHNYIPITDNRLLRRIVRDHKYRGVSAKDTIHRWPSVRAGEEKWIFPYQENCDVMFNTAMLYEFSVLREQAIPILEQVPESCEEYAEAYRLLKFLRYFAPVSGKQLPPTSLLREFVGGSSFKY